MSSVTATVVAAAPLAWLQVDVVVDNPGTVTAWSVTRVAAPLAEVVIRLGTTHSGAASYEDREAPLAVAITYRLNLTRAGGALEQYVSNVVSLAGTVGCFLSDPYTGQVMAIEVQAWPQRRYVSRSVSLEVIARADPVGLSDVHTWADGTWTLLTRDDAATEKMLAILTASGIAQLRTQPTTSIRSVYALTGDIGETRLTGSGTDARRLTDVELQEIAPIPAAARNLASTLLGLSTLADTLGGLALVRPTLLQLSQIHTG